MKWCSDCKQWKPKSEFNKDRLRKDGLQTICRECAHVRYKSYTLRNPGKMNARRQRYYWQNREQILKRKQNKDCLRAYGISYAWKLRLLDAQGGLCAICCRPLLPKEACVDHDHYTGVIRGILCSECNIALGCFKDNELVLERALEYKRRSGSGIESSDDDVKETETVAKVISIAR